MAKYYVTTAIPYVNAKPHIGHAYEFILADVIARHKRNQGDNVFFLTGVDEHGIKLFTTAREQNKDPKKLADINAKTFQELVKKLNVSADHFIRTTSPVHKKGAQEFWQACAKDIYKAEYEGLYCVGCEEYKSEKQLIDGKCPEHPNTKCEILKEENYFFKLSKYQDKIEHAIKSGKLLIEPATRANEILALIKDGLKDVPVSRPKSKLPWGVDVPGDPDHVMYVWFDALPNYVTGIGYGDTKRKSEFLSWWPADVHVIGKGILRFHAAMWPGMLLSAGLELPKTILVHGYINIAGQKMSKSLGNIVDPVALAEEHGTDALRYYLMREFSSTEDGDFSRDNFIKRYNFDLANDLGNLVQRVGSMIGKYADGRLPKRNVMGHKNGDEKINKLLNDFKTHEALDLIWDKVARANQYIEETKPWKSAKKEELLAEYIGQILDLAKLLEPFIPETANKIKKAFSGTKLGLLPILFPKIEQ